MTYMSGMYFTSRVIFTWEITLKSRVSAALIPIIKSSHLLTAGLIIRDEDTVNSPQIRTLFKDFAGARTSSVFTANRIMKGLNLHQPPTSRPNHLAVTFYAEASERSNSAIKRRTRKFCAKITLRTPSPVLRTIAPVMYFTSVYIHVKRISRYPRWAALSIRYARNSIIRIFARLNAIGRYILQNFSCSRLARGKGAREILKRDVYVYFKW